MMGPSDRVDLERLFWAGIRACAAETSLPGPLADIRAKSPLIIAIGKAAPAMARLASRKWPTAPGLVVARRGEDVSGNCLPVMIAGHPYPDRGSLEAGARLLAVVENGVQHDRVILLLSGGASALVARPAPGWTLAAKRRLTERLLASGASIGEINVIRRHVSAIKGGRLAVRSPVAFTTLAMSDVVSDAPHDIGSGPAAPDPTTIADARAALARYSIDIGDRPLSESVKPGDPRIATSSFQIIARARDAISAIAGEAIRLGYAPVILSDNLEGEARDLGAQHAALARSFRGKGRIALISGGELTVRLTGKRSGKGGPNFEYAAALAVGVDGVRGIRALAADSDGIDGNAGAAGAFLDGASAAASIQRDVALQAALSANDCASAFDALGDVFAPGPTGVNVNDLRIILVTDE